MSLVSMKNIGIDRAIFDTSTSNQSGSSVILQLFNDLRHSAGLVSKIDNTKINVKKVGVYSISFCIRGWSTSSTGTLTGSVSYRKNGGAWVEILASSLSNSQGHGFNVELILEISNPDTSLEFKTDSGFSLNNRYTGPQFHIIRI